MTSTFFTNRPHPESEETCCIRNNAAAMPLVAAIDEETELCCGFWDSGFWLAAVSAASPCLLSFYSSPTTTGFSLQNIGFKLPAPIRSISSAVLRGKRLVAVLADRFYILEWSAGQCTQLSAAETTYSHATVFSWRDSLYLIADGSVCALSDSFIPLSDTGNEIQAEGLYISKHRYDKLYEEGRATPGNMGGSAIIHHGKLLYCCCEATDRGGVECLDSFLCHSDDPSAVLNTAHNAQNEERKLSSRYLILPNGGVATLFENGQGELFAAFVGATAASSVYKRPAVVRLLLHEQGFFYPDSSFVYESLPVNLMRPVQNDINIRDTFINLMPDGYYYLTGTTARPAGDQRRGTNGICLWRSSDLQSFEPLGKVYDYQDIPENWQNRVSGAGHCWAPEICFHGDTYWLTYSTAPGCGLLRSVSGKPEGPYEDYGRVVNRGIDSGFFVDDDGSWYLVWQNGRIAKLNDRGNCFEQNPIMLMPADEHEVGYEGAGIIKVKGKYVLYAAEWHGDLRIDGSYDMMYSVSDTIYGPYSPRKLLVSHAGHGCLFWDKEGNLRYTIFGNDRTAPFRRRVGIGYLDIVQNGAELTLSARI